MNRPSPDDMKAMQVMEYIEELEKENKKLKEEVKKRKMVADENGEHYDMMKDEYEKLEKENKELKKELKKYKHYYDRDKEELMESCYALKKENDEMKNELAECHGLMDEIDYRKREAKRLGWKPNLMEEDTIKELKDIGEF